MFKISVKAARVNSGMKSKEAAKALGLSANGYCKKENGHARFYVDEIVTLSQLFKIPVEIFFEAGCLPGKQFENDTSLNQ